MLKTEITTIRATFISLSEGEPPSVRLYKLLQRPDGGQKSFSMSVPVLDVRLLARLRGELTRGDLVEITIEARWGEAVIPKTLLDFSKVAVPQDKTLTAVG